MIFNAVKWIFSSSDGVPFCGAELIADLLVEPLDCLPDEGGVNVSVLLMILKYFLKLFLEYRNIFIDNTPDEFVINSKIVMD